MLSPRERGVHVGTMQKGDTMRLDRLRAVAICTLAISMFVTTTTSVDAQQEGLWTIAGQDLSNTRNQGTERSMTRFNATTLDVAWQTILGADISATAAVDGEKVYVPDWGVNPGDKLDSGNGRMI